MYGTLAPVGCAVGIARFLNVHTTGEVDDL